MRASNHDDIRAHLHAYQDGLSVAELAKRFEVLQSSILKALKAMPDAYIDRWVEVFHKPPHAIWCAVIPPENCPKPTPKGRKKNG
jgi:hypothetical protein